MSEASFTKRDPLPGDPVVCTLCGATLGSRGGLSDEEAMESALTAHKPDCKRRLAVQMNSRRYAQPAVVEATDGEQ